MKNQAPRSRTLIAFLIVALFGFQSVAIGQSRPQRPTPTGNEKRNQRPTPKTEEQLKKEAEERRLQEEIKNAEVIDDPLRIETNIVNVDAVVFNKKTGRSSQASKGELRDLRERRETRHCRLRPPKPR